MLYQGACDTANVQLSYPMTDYKFIRLELCIGSKILNAVTVDMYEIRYENYELRSHWNDMSKVYYQDIKYISDNTISVACNDNAKNEGLKFRIIGSVRLIYTSE